MRVDVGYRYGTGYTLPARAPLLLTRIFTHVERIQTRERANLKKCPRAAYPWSSYPALSVKSFRLVVGRNGARASLVPSLVPRRSGRGEERTPGIYCLRMRAFSEISRKMGYSRNLPCNDYVEIPLQRIFARTSETAYVRVY